MNVPDQDLLGLLAREGCVSVPAQVEMALLDRDGVIVAVNDAWREFCVRNGGDVTRTGVGTSYLEICDAAADPGSRAVAASIRSALRGDLPAPATISISCPAPDAPRLFDVLVSSRLDDRGSCVGATVTLSQVETPSGPDQSAILTVRTEERERLAGVLNKLVISELFSLGLGIQGVLGGPIGAEQRARLAGYVDATDALISRIRSAVFDLTGQPGGASLKRRVLEAIDDQRTRHPFEISVAFRGPLDSTVDAGLADTVGEVVHDALSVVVLNPKVRKADVSVSLSASVVSVAVTDDGAGPGPGPGPGLGAGSQMLSRLHRLAEQRGGQLEVSTDPDGRMLVQWSARVMAEPGQHQSRPV